MPRKKEKGVVLEVVDLSEKAAILSYEKLGYIDAALKKKSFKKFDSTSCNYLYGISLATLNSWKNGSTKNGTANSTSLETLVERIQLLNENALRIGSDAISQKVDLDKLKDPSFILESNRYEFGECFGIDWKSARKLFDERLYLKTKSKSLLTVPKKALDYLTPLEGVWTAWHVSPTLVNGNIEYRFVRSWIDICHPVSKDTEDVIFRCRWHLPFVKENKLNSKITHYRYIGSVSYAASNASFSWLFEPKSEKDVELNPDFPYFVTQEATEIEDVQFGSYTSKSQDNFVYSSSIGLCRSDLNFRADLKGREEYNQYIQNTPRNCVFNSMAEARAEAKSENEAYLLDHYSPFCKVITNQYSNAFFHEEKLL